MSTVRIGFVGVGSMGQAAHLANYTDLEGCEVVALAEVRSGLARRVAQRYEVPRVYEDSAEMIQNENLDALVASQPFSRHGQILPELYESGLSIFTEKPLAGSIETAERLLEKLAHSSARHIVGYNKRCDPAVMHARKQIQSWKNSGDMGALRYIRVIMPAGDWIASGFTHMLRTDEIPPKSQDDPAPDMDRQEWQAYTAFVNYYIHQVNLIRHLLGESYRVTYADPSGVMLAVQSESGIAGTLEISPFKTTIDWQEEVLVAFERGWIKLKLPAPLAAFRPGQVTVFTDPGEGTQPVESVPQLPWIHSMRNQAAQFIRFIKGEATPLCEATEALEDLEVAKQYFELKDRKPVLAEV